MKIAIAHNRYQQAGGEDVVVAAEAALLQRRGHQVEWLTVDNEAIHGGPAKVKAALSSFFSVSAHRQARSFLAAFQPDVLHVHNFMPTLSPAIFFAAAEAHVPVVQTLHNYRIVCANAKLFREGQACERCLEQRSFLPGVRHGCYRGSRLGSAVIGGSMALHEHLGTWSGRISRYIALTHFAAEKLGSFRIPAHKIRVKPNFVPDRGLGSGEGGFALFVGRLSEEKGVETLLAADQAGLLPLPVWIAGDGPLHDRVMQACARPGSRLSFLGRQKPAEVLELMKQAAVLLVPSLWYEGFPMVTVEALSLGLPIIASRIGSLPEIVEEGVSGLLHTPGDPESLTHALGRFTRLAPSPRAALRRAARSRFLHHYAEEANGRRLLEIYAEAIFCTPETAKRAPELQLS